MDKEQNIKQFLADWERILSNPIYFLDEYWNKLHPDKKIELSDDEKQQIYNDNKIMVPVLNDMNDLHKYEQIIAEKRAQGLKDWEIF